MTEITDLDKVQYSNDLILTTEQLADFFGTSIDNIKKNFSNNKDRFVEGKHFYLLKGASLKAFKDEVNHIHLVGKRASSLYLWTKRGASRHAKILDTDKAWDVFDELEQSYFDNNKLKDVHPGQKVLPEDYVSALRLLADRTEEKEKLEKAAKLAAPKVSYYDGVLQSESLVTTTQIAKDYGMSARALNSKLYELGIQFKQGGQWFLYSKYQGSEYVQSKTYNNGGGITRLNTQWTQKGRKFIYEKLKENDILPVVENSNNSSVK